MRAIADEPSQLGMEVSHKHLQILYVTFFCGLKITNIAMMWYFEGLTTYNIWISIVVEIM
jgi:hypothetical protein